MRQKQHFFEKSIPLSSKKGRFSMKFNPYSIPVRDGIRFFRGIGAKKRRIAAWNQ